MTTLTRSFAILDLFTPARMVWSVEEIAEALGYSVPTTYRYVRDLVATGLLARFGDGAYSLGSRLVELDFLIRRADPVLCAGLPVVQDLVAKTGYDINLIGLYGDRIVTIHQERGNEMLPLSFGRGRLMPPLRGAGAKIIVAYLPRSQLRRIFDSYREDAKTYGLGDDWTGFANAMARLRHDGYAVSDGELDPGFFGLAAPIFGPERVVLGSIVAALSRQRQQIAHRDRLAELIKDGSDRISGALTGLDRRLSPADEPAEAPAQVSPSHQQGRRA